MDYPVYDWQFEEEIVVPDENHIDWKTRSMGDLHDSDHIPEPYDNTKSDE